MYYLFILFYSFCFSLYQFNSLEEVSLYVKFKTATENLVAYETPMGPGLNPFSKVGVIESIPLVGFDEIAVNGETGYLPLFGAAISGVKISSNPGDQEWINAVGYDGSPRQGVGCRSQMVIIGVRYKSHGDNKKSTPLPDILCSPIQSANVEVFDFGSVNQESAKKNTDGTYTVSSEKSVKTVNYCLLSSTHTFKVRKDNRQLNQCSTRVKSSSTSFTEINLKYSPDSLLRYEDVLGPFWMAMKKKEIDNYMPSSLLQDSYYHEQVKTSVFQDLSKYVNFYSKTDDYSSYLEGMISKPSSSAIDDLNSLFKTLNNGKAPPSASEVEAQFGPKPWDSSKLVNTTSLFSGTVGGGNRVQMLVSFSGDFGRGVFFTCGQIISCEKGTCSDTMCNCKTGYQGPNCSVKKTPCAKDPCNGNGACIENFALSTEYSCSCYGTFSGPTCNENSNLCIYKNSTTNSWDQVDCGHGTCQSLVGSYQCKCNEGWGQTGGITSKCNVKDVDCVGQWQPVGTCTKACKQQQKYIVSTPAQGKGKACPYVQDQTQEYSCNSGECKSCGSRNCLNGGSCNEATGKCDCPAGFFGYNCELPRDSCTTDKCNDHGYCKGSSCICVNGWTNGGLNNGPTEDGKYCTVDPCEGCPLDQCDKENGVCSCMAGTFSSFKSTNKKPCSKSSASVDCVGQWSSWTTCQPDCTQSRYYSVEIAAAAGGSECPNKANQKATQRCNSGSCCSLTEKDCKNGGTLAKYECKCMCKLGFTGSFCETSMSSADQVIKSEVVVDEKPKFVPLITTTEAPTPSPEPKSSNLGLIIGIVVAVLLLAGGGGYYYYTTTEQEKKGDQPSDAGIDEMLLGMDGLDGGDGLGDDIGMEDFPGL